jgi:outer membrane protein OmpA-like peptidoglycan-associated protein
MYRLMYQLLFPTIVLVTAACGGSAPPAPPVPAPAQTLPPGAQPVTPESDEQAYRDAEPERLEALLISFEGHTAKLQGGPGLFDLKDYFDKHRAVTLVRIDAHTADRGDEAERMQLTKDRAMAVARWLVANGVDCHRLLPVGFGSTQLPDRTAAFAPSADRIEAFKLAIRGHQLGTGRPEGAGENAGDPCAP